MSDFFATLERLSGGSERGGLPGWFSTHPSPVDRIAATRQTALEWQQKLGSQAWAINRDQYLKRLDGLVFGDDPRQGFVQDAMFYHPALRFQYPVPSGWLVQNLPSQVQFVSPDTAAVILLSIAQGTDPQVKAQEFIESTGCQVQSAGKTTVNGLSAYRLISDIQSEEASYRVQSYFIAMDSHIYILHGLSSPDRFSSYSSAFGTAMNGFAPLRDTAVLNVQPDRLDIGSAGQTAPLRALLSGHVTAELGEDDLAIMNGLQATDMVQAGSLYKFVTPGR
jgi:predicted Zn-dependent protease